MLDINRIRDNREEIEKALLKRMSHGELSSVIDVVLKLDDKRRIYIQKVDLLKSERNQYSKTKPTPDIIKKMREVGRQIKDYDENLRNIEKELNEKFSALPNIPADDVVAGGKENNKVLKTYGKKPAFKFQIKDHVTLATDLGIIDYERGAKMSGSGFWVYRDNGAVLEWALLNYFIEFHRKNKYT